jgi:thiopeptide-type bacteriocin biosynthesis protein
MHAHHLTHASTFPEAARWFHASVRFHDWAAAERITADLVGPRLDLLTASTARRWWFLRKHPHWRIRIADADPLQVTNLFSQLTEERVIDSWHQEIYEPEVHAFGGPAGMTTAHRLFCADSRGVLGYARLDNPPIGRRELSVLLTIALLNAARLDWFEHGDVFARIARIRPVPADDTNDKLAQLTRQLQALTATRAADVITRTGLSPICTPWLDAFTDAGRELSDSARKGALARGLRAVMAHLVIFHWNRLGLPAATQGILTRATTAVYLPED